MSAAQSGHSLVSHFMSLSGAKRTCRVALHMVAAWLHDVACGDIKIPKENFDVAVADHAAGLKQAHRLAKSL